MYVKHLARIFPANQLRACDVWLTYLTQRVLLSSESGNSVASLKYEKIAQHNVYPVTSMLIIIASNILQCHYTSTTEHILDVETKWIRKMRSSEPLAVRCTQGSQYSFFIPILLASAVAATLYLIIIIKGQIKYMIAAQWRTGLSLY